MTTPSTDTSLQVSAESQRPLASTVVVCSLEPWGEVRWRTHLLVDELVDLQPNLHVLYVDPPVPVALGRRRSGEDPGSQPRLRRVHPRIHVLRPRSWPAGLFARATRHWIDRQVLDAIGELGLQRPVLWINDPAFASLVESTGWPSLYELSEDWTQSSAPAHEHSGGAAGERLLLERADAVVVSSPDLARSRGRSRDVELIPNGVDVHMFRVPRPRPRILPEPPVALHVGTLDSDRLDVPLILELSTARPDLQIVLAGPIALPAETTDRLAAAANVTLLGPRPYEQIPALLQHADVVIVPHLVNPYTESLDPINAYECRAVGRPTVATPVSGFRSSGPPVAVAPREEFVQAVVEALAGADPSGTPGGLPDSAVPSWRERAEALAVLIDRVAIGPSP